MSCKLKGSGVPSAGNWDALALAHLVHKGTPVDFTPESWKDDREPRKLAPLVNAHSSVADACRSVIYQPEEEPRRLTFPVENRRCR